VEKLTSEERCCDMKNREQAIEIKHKKPYEHEGKENPVDMSDDKNMRKPVRGLSKG
jgi:hypothetical protein